jgi:hypothetical protein
VSKSTIKKRRLSIAAKASSFYYPKSVIRVYGINRPEKGKTDLG